MVTPLWRPRTSVDLHAAFVKDTATIVGNGYTTPIGDSRPTIGSMTGTLVILRHGQSEWNLANLFTGWHDVALTDQGRT